MLKPIYGAASIGVVRVNDEEQLEKAYKRVTRELAKAHIVAGALQQGSDEDEDDAANEAIEATVQQVSPMLCVIHHSSFFWGPARMQHDVPPEGRPVFTLTCVAPATLLNKGQDWSGLLSPVCIHLSWPQSPFQLHCYQTLVSVSNATVTE